MNAALAMPPIFRRVMPWAAMLDDLRDAGYSGYRVAKILGADWSTVQGWREGQPKHDYGQALIDLHRAACGEDMAKRRYNEARVIT